MSQKSGKEFEHIEDVAGCDARLRRIRRRPVCSMGTGASVDVAALIPDLLRHQRDAYESFLQINTPPERRLEKGLHGMLSRAFPVEGKNTTGVYILEYMGYQVREPLCTVAQARRRRMTYALPLYAKFRVSSWNSTKTACDSIFEEEICLGNIPAPAENGTFIINGVERTIVSQAHRSSGMFFDKAKNKDDYRSFTGRIAPHKGVWLDLESDLKNILYIRVDRRKKILASTFLMAMDDDSTWEKRKAGALAPHLAQGYSKEYLLKQFYQSYNCCIFDDTKWEMDFRPKLWEGTVAQYDILDCDGNVVVPAGSKVSQSQKIPARIVTDSNVLCGMFLAEDVVQENGIVLVEAGTKITRELLDTLTEVSILEIKESDPAAAFCTTVAADKCVTRWDAITDVIKVLRPGEDIKPQAAESYIHDIFFSIDRYDLSEIGRTKINERTGATYTDRTLHREDFLSMIRVLLDIRCGRDEFDDIDSLRNRRIRCIDELLESHCRQSIVKIAIAARDRISSVVPNSNISITPSYALLTKPFAISIREFFGSSQLSQLTDQANVLSEVSHKRRISAIGPGGVSRDHAGFEVRDVHISHYGRICPIETPEGSSVGLINSLSVHSHVNPHGFLTAEYVVVKDGKLTGQRVLCTYSQERGKIIAHYGTRVVDNVIQGDTITCRLNGESVEVTPDQIDLIDVSPFQTVSIAASMVPFAERNEPIRVLMGANMQRQALPLLRSEPPVVCTGSEAVIAADSGAVVTARNSGRVAYISHEMIVIEPEGSGVRSNDRYDLVRFAKSNACTIINQTPVSTLKVGDFVNQGDIIADCASTKDGEVSLGRNVIIAFAQWHGYNFEDAVVVSDSLVKGKYKDLTSAHIIQCETVAHDTKSGEELFTKDIPNVPSEALDKLDDNGIVRIGTKVKHGDILIGKVAPKAEGGMIPEEKLLCSIFGTKASDVYDVSLRVPTGVEGVVTDVQVISRRLYMDDDEIRACTESERKEVLRACKVERDLWFEKVKREFPSAAKLQIQSHCVNLDLSALLKVTSKSLPDYVDTVDDESESDGQDKTERVAEKLSFLSKDDLTDWAVLSQLGCEVALSLPIDDEQGYLESARKELKDINARRTTQLQDVTRAYRASSDELPPGVVRSARVFITSKRLIQPGDKIAGRFGNKCVVSTIVPEADMPYMEDGTPVDIIFNSLGVPSRMNLGQVFESVCGMISHLLAEQIQYYLRLGDTPKVRELMSRIYEKQVESLSDDELLAQAKCAVKDGIAMLAMPFCSPKVEDMDKFLEFAGVDKSCKYTLYDGQSGEKLLRKVAVGQMYVMRLNHDVDDKAHARSTGPYGLLNQQPLGGKAQFGGQRVGEMEVHALQAFGVAYNLLEILTVKSDDIQGRLQVFDAFVRGDDRFTVGTPESFKIFCLYAKALCLNVSCIDRAEGQIIPGILDYSISPKLPDMEIKFSIASPSDVLDWSYGEVESTETNYHRTDRPVHKGLFCSRIFGPTVSFECGCGKYKRMKYRGIVCERCGVEVTHSKVRRERMGHIMLAVPVAHVWFTRILPSRIGMLLGMSVRTLEGILGCEMYVVTNPGNTDYTYGQLISTKEYDKLGISDTGSAVGFSAETGGEAIEMLLKAINLEEEEEVLRQELAEATSEAKRKKVSKKLDLVRSLLNSGTCPEYMTIRVLPVIPAGLRPIVVIHDSYGRVGTVGINDLYKTVLNRNNRFKMFMRINAPDEIKRNEKRSLQQAVDTLLDNGRNGVPVADNSGRKYRSLSSFIKGKQGICRQDILGKRVDYSGRSVIVVGPELKLDQCALPRKMALELFKPHVMHKLESYGFASTLRAARKLIEQEVDEVWDILAEVIKDRPVLLNRAPTLHRLGIQGFNPVLTEGKSIRLHPLVCSAFNADFDGDQMSVHVPLSCEARLEAHFIMLSTENLLNPANGMPIIAPSQDIVLGIYKLTHVYDIAIKSSYVMACFEEVVQQFDLGRLGLQDMVQVLHCGKVVETTPGRIIFYQAMPSGIDFNIVNRTFRKKDINIMLHDVYKSHGSRVMTKFADEVKQIGFYWTTRSGSTIGKDDFIKVKGIKPAIETAQATIKECEAQQREGLIAHTELASKKIDAYAKCTTSISESMMREISVPGPDGLNPLFEAQDSEARGSVSQCCLMIGWRGLVSKADNTIILWPILSNYREGIDPYGLFLCAYGSRKGSADTALKTSFAGHLSRKLVEACQDCVVRCEDCGTPEGLCIKAAVDNSGMKTSMYNIVKGRVLAKDLVHPKTQEVLLPAGTMIGEQEKEVLEQLFVNSVHIRSPVKCRARNGICAYCYGVDLSSDRLVSLGEVVGVVAAQSIGEPGAQLTMDTFHSGGVAHHTSVQSDIVAGVPGTVSFNGKCVIDKNGTRVVVSRNAELSILQDEVQMVYRRVPYGARVMIEDQDVVEQGKVLATWDPYNSLVLAEYSGRIALHDLVEGISLTREVDELTGITTSIVSEWKHITGGGFHPRIDIVDDKTGKFATFNLIPGSLVEVSDGQDVSPGEIVAKIPKESIVSQDITGGLPRVSELLEARHGIKGQAIIADIDGYVEADGEHRGRNRLAICAENGEKFSFQVPQGAAVFVQPGDFVRKGDQLTGGAVSAHCILRVLGIDAVVEHMIKEVQAVYEMQGVRINSKHLEIVVRQMLQKREVIDPGDSDLTVGNYIDNIDFEDLNAELVARDARPVVANMILMGITNSVIHSRSALSSVSFQNSIRTFVKESIAGKKRRVSSPKDSVVVASLMDAGTGFPVRRWIRMVTDKIAAEYDLEQGKFDSASDAETDYGSSRSDAESVMSDSDQE